LGAYVLSASKSKIYQRSIFCVTNHFYCSSFNFEAHLLFCFQIVMVVVPLFLLCRL